MAVINVNQKTKLTEKIVALIRINLYLIYNLCSADCLITSISVYFLPVRQVGRPQVNMTFIIMSLCEDCFNSLKLKVIF